MPKGLFTPGYRYTVAQGSALHPAKQYRAALKIATREAKKWGDVVHVLERQGRGRRDYTTVATCVPKPPTSAGSRVKAVTCYLKKKPLDGSRRRRRR